MWDSIHFTTKRFLLKYKIVLFYKYVCSLWKYVEKWSVVARWSKRRVIYEEVCVVECLLTFAEILEFVSISSFTIASFCVNFRKHFVLDPKLSGTEKSIRYCCWSSMHVNAVTYNTRIKNELGNHQTWHWLLVRYM